MSPSYRRQNWMAFNLLQLLSFFVAAFSILLSCELRVAEAAANFAIDGEKYACGVNIICLGNAHIYPGNNTRNFSGSLSLTHWDKLELDEKSAGIAYYKEPIRLLDPSTHRSASFNTSFEFFEVPWVHNGTVYPGDGMTFVLSANNSTVGGAAYYFGFFDDQGVSQGITSFKSLAIEFDNYNNTWPPTFDINDNHVSIDIQNVTVYANAVRNASDVGIRLSNQTVVYAWVEYAADIQTLEVRISYRKSRPLQPFISLPRLNLSDVVEEYMWVGFTASNGGGYCSYYVGSWSFQAYGIPPEAYREATRSRLGIVLGTSGGIFAFVVVLVLVSITLWLLRRRVFQARIMQGKFPLLWLMNDSNGGLYGDELQLLVQKGYQFTYKELSEATKGFADEAKLGEGGFGCVYRGELHKSKFPVAVKKITRESQHGEKEFKAEVSIISQLRHRNLIRLLGWCIHEGKYYIVYDLMPNGSLDKVLFTPDLQNFMVLSWAQRFKIIQGTATAVEYLHHGWNQQVIHRDIKASNIMLDDHWNAKLGDFGLARLTNHHQTPNTTMVAGTPGYIAPEAMSSRRFTEKTDVFAFGALALEIACGRRPLMLHGETEEMLLVDWVWQRFSQGKLLSVADKRLVEFDVEQMETLLLLGLICSHPDPLARPPMRVVVQVLYGDVPTPRVPTSKPPSAPKEKITSMDAHLK